MELQLRLSGFHNEVLTKHLFPSDGKEAVAVALCGRFSNPDHEILLVYDLTLIPYDECYTREDVILRWSTKSIHHYFERIGKEDLALLKIHSHPGGYDHFSNIDDASDHDFFDSAFGWSMNDKPHASAIMLPGGRIFGRFFFKDLHYEPIDTIQIAGDTIQIYKNFNSLFNAEFALRTIQAFGDHTYQKLSQLTVGVVGCSGTGSPVIEQLTRLGIGKLVLIDPDVVEKKNLNRIINSTANDAKMKKPKVHVLAEAISKMGLETKVSFYQTNLFSSINSLRALVTCNVIFGCMDSVDGRHILNQLCCFYLLPYFDLGVKLEADGTGGINQICGSVNYLQPCKSSLLTRGVYTMEDLRAASQFRKNPEEFENLKRNAYIKNINVNSPAVISVNMQIASHAVNEFLNRIHPFRVDHPSRYAKNTIDMTENYIINLSEEEFEVDSYLKKKSGRGDIQPFIELSELIT
jgi:hypothetical protein